MIPQCTLCSKLTANAGSHICRISVTAYDMQDNDQKILKNMLLRKYENWSHTTLCTVYKIESSKNVAVTL